MKTIKTLVFAIAITFSTMLNASEKPTTNEPTVIETEIGALLENPQFEIKKDELAKVTFFVNSKSEIIVLNVLTDNTNLENFIKARLNYKKMKATGSVNKTYVMPVRLKLK